ncbi:MAG: hypothetical protein K2Z81_24790 [Cyanobacteria bacterium]|nr:hypothetical protein [Cyanobacteriota bacterium]
MSQFEERLKGTTIWLHSQNELNSVHSEGDSEVQTIEKDPKEDTELADKDERKEAVGIDLLDSDGRTSYQGSRTDALQEILPVEEYEVLGVVGESPVCKVYKVRNHRLNTVMALKILKDEFQDSAVARKQFAREINASITLCHPHIVPIFGHGKLKDDSAFLVERLMENSRSIEER